MYTVPVTQDFQVGSKVVILVMSMACKVGFGLLLTVVYVLICISLDIVML